MEITAIETRRHNITGTAQDSVVDMVEVEAGTTAEAAVREGAMVQPPTPPPPPPTGRKLWAVDRPVKKEVGRCRHNDGLGGGDKIFVRPSVEVITVRSAIGAHRILVSPAIAALTEY